MSVHEHCCNKCVCVCVCVCACVCAHAHMRACGDAGTIYNTIRHVHTKFDESKGHSS